jgi:hypothetical protein
MHEFRVQLQRKLANQNKNCNFTRKLKFQTVKMIGAYIVNINTNSFSR